MHESRFKASQNTCVKLNSITAILSLYNPKKYHKICDLLKIRFKTTEFAIAVANRFS